MTDAEQLLKALRTLLAQAAKPGLTVAEVIAKYLQCARLRVTLKQLDPRSLDRAVYYTKLFCEAYGGKRLPECHRSDLIAFLESHPEWNRTTPAMTPFRAW